MEPKRHFDDYVRHFIRTWKLLASYWWVDAWGSAEQRRVFQEWLTAGKPLPCRPFILKRANHAPEGVK